MEALNRGVAASMFLGGAGSGVVALVFAVFLGTADHADGKVSKITTSQSCTSLTGTSATRRIGRSTRDCTTYFWAEVAYAEKNGDRHTVTVDAGEARGRNEPVSKAQHKVGDRIAVSYSRPVPGWAYREGFGPVAAAFWWWARFPMVAVVGPAVFWIAFTVTRLRSGR
jgi:hypothetical protein